MTSAVPSSVYDLVKQRQAEFRETIRRQATQEAQTIAVDTNPMPLVSSEQDDRERRRLLKEILDDECGDKSGSSSSSVSDESDEEEFKDAQKTKKKNKGARRTKKKAGNDDDDEEEEEEDDIETSADRAMIDNTSFDHQNEPPPHLAFRRADDQAHIENMKRASQFARGGVITELAEHAVCAGYENHKAESGSGDDDDDDDGGGDDDDDDNLDLISDDLDISCDGDDAASDQEDEDPYNLEKHREHIREKARIHGDTGVVSALDTFLAASALPSSAHDSAYVERLGEIVRRLDTEKNAVPSAVSAPPPTVPSAIDPKTFSRLFLSVLVPRYFAGSESRAAPAPTRCTLTGKSIQRGEMADWVALALPNESDKCLFPLTRAAVVPEALEAGPVLVVKRPDLVGWFLTQLQKAHRGAGEPKILVDATKDRAPVYFNGDGVPDTDGYEWSAAATWHILHTCFEYAETCPLDTHVKHGTRQPYIAWPRHLKAEFIPFSTRNARGIADFVMTQLRNPSCPRTSRPETEDAAQAPRALELIAKTGFGDPETRKFHTKRKLADKHRTVADLAKHYFYGRLFDALFALE